MSNTSEQPRRRGSFGPASFTIGLLGIIVALALLQRSSGQAASGRLLLVTCVVLLCSLLAGASAFHALARRESGRAYAFFGIYFCVAGILYIIRELFF